MWKGHEENEVYDLSVLDCYFFGGFWVRLLSLQLHWHGVAFHGVRHIIPIVYTGHEEERVRDERGTVAFTCI